MLNETIDTLSQANELNFGYEFRLDKTFPGLLHRCETCDSIVPLRRHEDAWVCRVCETAWGGRLSGTIKAVRAGADISEEKFWCSLANGILDEVTGRKYRAVGLLETLVEPNQKGASANAPAKA